ncbi:EAL domain-containing protein [Leptolyngbya subtilissima]|uniref:EAL domain-containing protein n=2 Tax=Cyanophyceae TaxID=3028117 RepID=A0ABV0KB46_9CYAN|nr:EAL domain-containing protein [Nodosilinea sp. FACHB-141]
MRQPTMSHELFADRIPEILVADDTLDALRLLSNALSSHGYDVRSVTSGLMAIASVQAALPDLILLDIKMPDLTGYEVCQRLKADPKTQEIPVIFISALDETFDKVKAFQLGGVDYITKPFQIEEVLARVQNQLALRFSVTQIHRLNAQLEQQVQNRTAQLQAVNQTLTQEVLERRQIEHDLRESEEKFRQISENIRAVFWLTDFDSQTGQETQTRYVSPSIESIWGQPRELFYQDPQTWTNSIHPEDRDRVIAAFLTQAHLGQYDEEFRIVRPDGTIRWIHDRGFPIHDETGAVYRLTGVAEDITDQVQAELERDRFFNLSLDLLFIADRQGQLKRLNPAWQSMMGYPCDQLIDQPFATIVHPEDLPLAEQVLQQLLRGEEVNEVEMRCRCANGSYLWIAWNGVPFLQEHLIYGAGRDISQRKASESRLMHETLHDALTGLANRPCFMERLQLAIKQQRRHQTSCFAVLFIDLDGFKSVNDTLGHGVGDQLLIRVSQLLLETVREVDSVARLGGDEFTILLENIQHPEEVVDIAERIQQKLGPALAIGHHDIFTSASIGIVIGAPEYQQVADILRDADIAMYQAKANGKARYEVFNSAMYAATLQHVEIETHLRHAILNNELEIHYQPIVSLQPERGLEGFEVLLRWRHPQKGLVPAGEFIPIAEETGLINAIGEWALQEACMQFSHWQQLWPDFAKLYLSVNISGRQLREPSLLQTLDRMLEETHIPVRCLRFEITESSLIKNTAIATQLLERMQIRGIQVSLDDFGTGFSSLSYLHQFPINTIKIDRSFVNVMLHGEKERSIIQSIVALAKTLGLATIAEGIETRQQLEALQSLGCESGQGFFFARPMPPAQLEAFLTQTCQQCPVRHICFTDCHRVAAH